jgi:hypothetical protein
MYEVAAVRIWDVPPEMLCRNHLLGEHGELHGVWSTLTQARQSGYCSHPEVRRWEGKLKALYHKHEEIVEEMRRRGYNHQSPLNPEFATGAERQDTFVDSYEEQVEILKKKGCDCLVR